jgi:hypothetical protein
LRLNGLPEGKNSSNYYGVAEIPLQTSTRKIKFRQIIFASVHGFKGSGVQGSILVPGLHLRCVFTREASASSGPIQNLERNWQLFGKMSVFNEDFGPSIPSLSLTLNVEL